MESTEIKAGDVVALKSGGGIAMTVGGVSGRTGLAHCFYTHNLQIVSVQIPPAALKKLNK